MGGRLDRTLASPVAYCPVSIVRYRNGKEGVFPHILDRGKPGVIGVLANGKRFVNEALGYHDYTLAMVEQVPEGEEVCSWLIADQQYVRYLPLGMAKPLPIPIQPYLRSGVPHAWAHSSGLGREDRRRPPRAVGENRRSFQYRGRGR